MVEHPILRAVFDLRMAEERAWYADRAQVTSLVDVVASTSLGSALTHAGVYGVPRPLKKAGALAAAIAKGKKGEFQALDAVEEATANIAVSLGFRDSGLDVIVMVGAEAYRSRAATLLEDVEQLGLGLFAQMRTLGAGVSLAFAHPTAREIYRYPRVRPPVSHLRLKTSAILELFDVSFHRGEHEDALGAEIEALASAPIPAGVTRRTHDGLTVTRWIDDLSDDLAVARAAGRHEQWMAGLANVRRADSYSAQGDQRVPVRKSERAPFTFFDASKGAGYKAIMVDPTGEPDGEVWQELCAIAAAPPADLKTVWLIAPLRELALGLSERAKAKGFAGVLYPSGDQLWNPRPEGWWLDEERTQGNRSE